MKPAKTRRLASLFFAAFALTALQWCAAQSTTQPTRQFSPFGRPMSPGAMGAFTRPTTSGPFGDGGPVARLASRQSFQPGSTRVLQGEEIPLGETIIDGEGMIVGEGDIVYESGPMFEGGMPGQFEGNSRIFGMPAMIDNPFTPTYPPATFQLFAGGHGFTGRPNRGAAGSFGFHEGVNATFQVPWLRWFGISGQMGLRASHSNFNGSFISMDNRDQFFVTGGLFRRVDWGLQFGVVADFLHEDWYTSMNLLQIRSELSWMWPEIHEFGFRMTQGIVTDTSAAVFISPRTGMRTVQAETWQPQDSYLFFYRRRYEQVAGAESQLFGGLTNGSDGMFGYSAAVPFNDFWALNGEFTYLIPEGGMGAGTRGENESWNFAVQMVVHPFGGARFRDGNYQRSLFPVAGNGTLLLDRRQID